MHRRYNRNKAKALSERGRRMAAARWKADRARRDALEPERLRELAEMEVENLPRREGDPLGCLQWTDFSTGKVRRWTIRIGDRADRITLHAPDGRATRSHGWSWVMTRLRAWIIRPTT
jgi:hypothetical protein